MGVEVIMTYFTVLAQYYMQNQDANLPIRFNLLAWAYILFSVVVTFILK
jgi:hypothetical protein